VRITVPAPAKINLWLRVGDRQPSGFHDLDTLFCALDLADTVTVRSAEVGTGIRLDARFAPPLYDAPDLGPDPDNLAVRAAAAFLDCAGLPRDVRIRLVKRIPAGGGLGGGSSDAAAVLRALARLHPDAIDPVALQHLASTLGSDVPFFAAGQALARGRGRGGDLTPVMPLPARAVLLVLPPFSILTADAYRWLAEARASGGSEPHSLPPAEPLPQASWAYVQGQAGNDFEPIIFQRSPRLAAFRDVLIHHGARPALLAGSGSTVFGVFEDQDAARAAGDAIRHEDRDARILVTRTRSR
jgi:4-diphosphocytidyl-2-C-methyl-D-erythritol kinase